MGYYILDHHVENENMKEFITTQLCVQDLKTFRGIPKVLYYAHTKIEYGGYVMLLEKKGKVFSFLFLIESMKC